MGVTMLGDVIKVQMPVNHRLIAYYYKKVGSEWVKYKRETLLQACA